MRPEEKEVLDATLRFYDAIDRLVDGEGAEAVKAIWHHTPDVSSSHPTGDWAHGWEEVAATWDVFASLGRKGAGGARVQDVRVHVDGDLAYTTSVFVASPQWGGARLNCTNVLRRIDGTWKVVHHHPDKAPSMEKSLEKIVGET